MDSQNQISSKDPDCCLDCKGSGKYKGLLKIEDCSACKGKGKLSSKEEETGFTEVWEHGFAIWG